MHQVMPGLGNLRQHTLFGTNACTTPRDTASRNNCRLCKNRPARSKGEQPSDATAGAHFCFAFCLAAAGVMCSLFAFAGRGRSAVTSALAPQTVFNVVTLAVMPVYGLMVAFPRKPLVREAVSFPGPALGHENRLHQGHVWCQSIIIPRPSATQKAVTRRQPCGACRQRLCPECAAAICCLLRFAACLCCMPSKGYCAWPHGCLDTTSSVTF